MGSLDYIAQKLYEAHCATRGYERRHPSWEELLADERKLPIVEVWRKAAERSLIAAPAEQKAATGGWG